MMCFCFTHCLLELLEPTRVLTHVGVEVLVVGSQKSASVLVFTDSILNPGMMRGKNVFSCIVAQF